MMSVGAIMTALFGLGIVSHRSPFAIIATGFTLDPWTGFYRLLIWQHGLDNVARSPLFGIGLGDWTREWWMASDSVDAFWLVIMMRMGVPALVMLILAITLLFVAVHQQRIGMTKDIRKLVIAWTFSVLAISLAGCTVHYWNNLHAYFFFMLGLMAWVGDTKLARKRAQVAAAARGKAAAALAPAPSLPIGEAPRRPSPVFPGLVPEPAHAGADAPRRTMPLITPPLTGSLCVRAYAVV